MITYKDRLLVDVLARCIDEGKIVDVAFRKRTDGSLRRMRCRVEAPDWDRRVIRVYDLQKRGFRSFGIESIIWLRAFGFLLVIDEETSGVQL